MYWLGALVAGIGLCVVGFGTWAVARIGTPKVSAANEDEVRALGRKVIAVGLVFIAAGGLLILLSAFSVI